MVASHSGVEQDAALAVELVDTELASELDVSAKLELELELMLELALELKLEMGLGVGVDEGDPPPPPQAVNKIVTIDGTRKYNFIFSFPFIYE